ncbi:MAG: magnesium transporter [Aggregatilineales bacterium]
METVNDLYVLNGGNQLVGVVSLREVVTSSPERRISEIMETDVITATPETDQEEVARMIARYDFLAMPIVANDCRMLGIVTVDDAIDVLAEEHTEDMLRLGAVSDGGTFDQPYFTTRIQSVLRRRLPWLLLLFGAGTLTGSVMQHFEVELERVVALTFFIPLLIGMGGNTGAQTVSTIIRGIAVHDIRFRDIGRVVGRELLSGLMLGVILGVVGFAYAYVWIGQSNIALVVGLGFLAISTWANTIGALIPLLAFRAGVDPALVSAPLISTLVDATGLFIYLTIAGILLGL